MIRILIEILIISSISIYLTNSQKTRNILFNEFKTKRLGDINVWRNQLRADFIANLQQLSDPVKNAIIGKAEEQLKITWEPLLALDYLDYKFAGNKDKYQNKYINRRKRVQTFVLSEMLSSNGRYINEIANGLWLILEESTWTWSALMAVQTVTNNDLPDPAQNILDLGAGETSAIVAWIGFLLGDRLSQISPNLMKRLNVELDQRIFQNYLNSNYNWMALNGKDSNNWNPRINSDILISALLNINDTRMPNVIRKTISSVDGWLNLYGDDGGCDEGPDYWGVEGGQFIQYIYYLTTANANQNDWSSNQLINNIGSYIYKTHIDNSYFVNFGDVQPKLIPDPNKVYLYGQTLNNNVMKGFSSYLYQLGDKDSRLISYSQSENLHQFYLQMSAYNQIKTIPPKTPQPLESWLPDLQVLTIRSQEGSAKGLFLGAKGGTNNESYNHNDVGNFVLYVNGMPAIIDVGPGTNTANTFDKDRYENWNLQSEWHNTPTINGIQQRDGNTFRAKNVGYRSLPNGGEFVADISGAYPHESNVKSWVRKLTFDRNANTVTLTENYSLSKFLLPFKLHFITILKPNYDDRNGQIVLNNNPQIVINFRQDQFSVELSEYKIVEPQILSNWGDKVIRVSLVSKLNTLVGEHTITFRI